MAAQSVGPGRTRQNRIYRAGALGRRPRVPADAAGLERAAHRRMSRTAWAYVAGGAGEGAAMTANRAAFDRWQLVPRVLRDVATRDLSTTLLGRTLPAPVLLAPVGAAGLVRPRADVLIGEAAARCGIPYVLSSQGSRPMEETTAAMDAVAPGAPRWFQLYWGTDDRLVDSFVGRAEDCGAGAVVLTLDTTMLGWRPQDLSLGSLPFARGIGIAQYTSDPRFRELVAERMAATGPAARPDVTLGAVRTLVAMSRNHPGRFRDNLRSPVARASVEAFLDVYSNPALTWEHVESLRRRTRLPVVLKGILHPDDARRALDVGVNAVMVSNHGGRQVDRSVAALDALVAVREAVGPEPTLLLDGGVRTGADVLLALALGADAVTLGRPHVYGLALDGRDGVQAVVDNVVAELDLTLGLLGLTNLAQATRDVVQPRPR